MAISYSYPMGTPKLTDVVLGVQYEEMKDPAVKNFSIGDIVTLAVDEVGIPTLQQVTGEGANTTVQIQINGVDVATLDDIPGTPTLQEVTDEGDTTTNDITANTFSTQGAKVWDDGTIEGSSFQFSSSTGSLQSAAQDNKAWVLPDESGTIALTKYKVYTAILTQTGTAAPVATVLENTLGGTVTFSRTQAGQYNIISSAKFGNTPPFIILGSNREPINVGGIVTNLITRYQSSSNIDFWSMNSAYNNFIEGYGAINNLAIEIRVYN